MSRAAGSAGRSGTADRLAGPSTSPTNEDLNMKWETPVAIDLRFGMEITMYVASR